jgi:ubiquinone/menaquinone biosynthesis C-methylase UbiE
MGELITSNWTTQAVYVAAKLGISDLIHQRGPLTAAELAEATGVLAEPLFRVLRALASLTVYREREDGRFELTPLADQLRKDVPGSQHAIAIMMGEEHYQAWGELLYSVKTGKTAFDKIYGKPIFEWLGEHPEQAATFDAAMVSIHGRETDAMIDSYDFSQFAIVADVGGGNGSVLRAILKRVPGVRAMLCDLPGVIERAKPLIAAEGLADRLELKPTNFFEAVPAGADAYLMRHIIHDWTDEQSLVILKNIRKVIGSGGKLLVIEGVVPIGNEPSFSKLLDLNMMVMPGGKERTEAEYRELFAAGGFRLQRIVPTESDIQVLESVPV